MVWWGGLVSVSGVAERFGGVGTGWEDASDGTAKDGRYIYIYLSV